MVAVMVAVPTGAAHARPARDSARTRSSRTSASVWVAPDGSDDNPGSQSAPMRTIAAAMASAAPGSVIDVAAGTYPETLVTRTSGTAAAPITLRGHDAVLTGDGSSGRILQVRNDNWTIEGLTMRGQDSAIWIEGAHHVVVRDNLIEHFRGECVRIKYLSSEVLVERNTIRDCGLDDFVENPGSGKNGEGVYIGTAPEQLDRNPTSGPDTTTDVTVRDNRIATRGSECVDIKEAATANVVEFNACSDEADPDSGGFDSRGSGNVFRYNRSTGAKGAGIRLGGDTERDGLHNDVIGNELLDDAGYAIKVMRSPQGQICGNVVERAGSGLSNVKSVDNPRCAGDLPKAGPRYPTPGETGNQ
jgi:nitrous oxidase accessory protein NosD